MADLDEHGHLIGWRDRRDRFDWQGRAGVATILRTIADAAQASRHCKRRDCRRAGRCVAPKADCAWQHFDVLQEHVFPAIQRALKKRDGERAEESEAP